MPQTKKTTLFANYLKTLIIFPLLLLTLSGCINENQYTQGNPTPKDFLDNDDADIFVLDDIVYSNAEDVEWVSDLDYKVGEEIAEITKQADSAFGFSDNTANKLPVGTKIYETWTPAYIAIVDGREIAYLQMIEGWIFYKYIFTPARL